MWEYIDKLNWQTSIAMFAIVWYFTRDLKQSIENLDRDVREMNSRVGRIEGTVYGRETYKNLTDKK